METEIKNEIENLAIMVKNGFDEVAKQFLQVDKRFEQVDKRFEQVDKRFESIDHRFLDLTSELQSFKYETRKNFEEINKSVFTRTEKEDILGRVSYVETKLGIESGA